MKKFVEYYTISEKKSGVICVGETIDFLLNFLYNAMCDCLSC